MANLVNYFGKSENVDDINIYPILFEKGNTHFALYGLGYIRDERLHATFQERKVRFFRPHDKQDEWFSVFCIHQNRFALFLASSFLFFPSSNLI
jgi:double-strand break repair protein MRE11